MTETKPPTDRPTTVMVCVNRRFRADEPSCAQRNSHELADALERGIRERRIDITLERSICMGHCQTGPTVRLAPGGRFFHGPSPQQVDDILDELERRCGVRQATDPASPAFMPGS